MGETGLTRSTEIASIPATFGCVPGRLCVEILAKNRGLIVEDMTFRIDGESESPARLCARARQFNITIDEPPSLGGEDLGANPVEYLLASYAGCLNVVAHMAAKELGIEIDKLSISVSGNLNPARLYGQSQAERAGFKAIHVTFSPVCNASKEELDTWVSTIKDRCPINDNLASPTPMTFSVG